jgi:dolichyl-phosphate beta-glucosyltransferase
MGPAGRVPALSLVVPAHDEEARLPRTLAAASAALPSLALASEIVVVDDGSRDRTAEIARVSGGAVPVRVVRLAENRGKGAAVAAGVAAARHALVAFTDADCPYDLESLRPMLAALDGGRVDVAIGARELPGSQVNRGYGVARYVSGQMFSFLTWLVIGLPFRDSQCGLKAFRRQAARPLFSVRTVDRFGFDFELLAAAVANGLVVERFPVSLTHDDDSHIDLIRDSLEMLRDLMRVRRNLRRGVYRFAPERGEIIPEGAIPSGTRCPVCEGSASAPRVARAGHRMVECGSCGLWYLSPMPGPEVLERLYAGSYFSTADAAASGYDDYGAQADDLRATFRRRLALLGDIPPGATILDVGGGYGYLADAAADDPRFAERWVVEANPEAAHRVSARHRTVVGWFPDVPLPDGAFDVVSLQDFLEHLPNPRGALERTHALLRRGGSLLLTTPNTKSAVARLQGLRWVSLKFPEHVALYSPESATRLLAETGFRVRRLIRAGQRVSLDFLATRVLSGWPRAGRALARVLGALGVGRLRVWVPSGSITVIATAGEPGEGQPASGEAVADRPAAHSAAGTG